MTTPIDVTAQPIDDSRCEFVLSEPIAGEADSSDSPVAQAILKVPGICEVAIAGNVVTAVKDDESLPWRALEPQVRYAVNTAVAQMASPVGTAGSANVADDDMFDIVDQMFEREINPAVAQHGGKVELIDVQDKTVIVRMMGGCQGCGMADVTLRQGIESSLKRALPSLQGLKDITDHAAGTNPYFAAGSK